MRKLALSDEILLSVDKPARYIGGEINMIKNNLFIVISIYLSAKLQCFW